MPPRDDEPFRLLAILDRQVRICEQLLALNNRERTVIGGGRDEDIAALLARKAQALNALETLGVELVSAVEQPRKASPTGEDFLTVLRRAVGGHVRVLEDLLARRARLANEIMEVSSRNRMLLASRVAIAQETLGVLVPMALRNGQYSRRGDPVRLASAAGTYDASV